MDGSVEEFENLRTEAPEEYLELVAHCVRVGVDLGCDLIKTQFLEQQSGYSRILSAASGVPVVIAGGPLIAEERAAERATVALQAGIRGISFARNVFGRADPWQFYQKLDEMLGTAK